MKKSRSTDSQVLAILKQNKVGTSVFDLYHEHDMTDATFYKRRANYSDMNPTLMKRMLGAERRKSSA